MRTSFVLLLVACAAPAAPVPTDPVPRDREGNPLPKGATARLGSLAFRGPRHYGLAFTPDGKTLLACDNGSVYSWDATTGKRFPTMECGNYGGSTIAVAGRAFVVHGIAPRADRGNSHAVTTFDRTTGKKLSSIEVDFTLPSRFAADDEPSYPADASVSACGTRVAVVNRRAKRLAVYDTGTGKRLCSWPCQFSTQCVLAPDGNTVYTQSDGPIARYDVKTGKALGDLAGTDEGTKLVVPSPDGKLVATRGSFETSRSIHDTFVRVHDTAKNEVLRKIELGSPAKQLEWGGGALFVDAYEHEHRAFALERWNPTTGERAWRVRLPGWFRFCVSADGTRVALTNGTTIHLRDGATGKLLSDVPGHTASVRWIGWSPDGRTVRTAAKDGVCVWALDGERRAVARPTELRDGWLPSFKPGNALVWSLADREGKKWELVGWDFEKNALGWRVPLGAEEPGRVFSADGRRAVAIGWNERPLRFIVTEIDGPTGKVRAVGTIDPETSSEQLDRWPEFATSADGSKVFVGDKTVRAFDVRTGKTGSVSQVGASFTFSFAVSPDGTRVALVPERKAARNVPPFLTVLDAKTEKKLVEHKLDFTTQALAFNATGTLLAAWSWDCPLRVYRADANEMPLDFTLEGMRPTCAAFSPNGASLAVGYQDGTALIWDVTARPKE